MSNIEISRRGSLSVLGAAAIAPMPAAAQSLRLLDLSKREDFFDAVLKMRASKDEKMRMGFIVGRYYGSMAATMTPLFGMIAGTFSKFRKLPDGRYEGISYELAYFTDWDTGELLTTFKNPLNGKTVKVEQLMRIGPSRTYYSPGHFEESPDRLPPGLKRTHRILPARVVGDDVWFVEENFVKPDPDAKVKLSFGEVSTFHSSLKALSDPAAPHAPTDVHFTMNIGWRPWLEMGDTPGHLFAAGTGKFVERIEDMPQDFLSLARKYSADDIKDPAAMLAEATF